MKKQVVILSEEQLRQNALVSNKLIGSYFLNDTLPLIKACIKQAHGDAGFYAVFNERGEALAEKMVIDINRFHRDLSFEEVKEAFYLGARNKFGPYNTISVVVMNEWLNAYRVSQPRQDAIRRVRGVKKIVSTIKEQSEKEIADFQAGLIDRIKKEYADTGTVSNIANNQYDFLVKKGLIPADDYKKYILDAKGIQHGELLKEAEQSAGDRFKVKRLQEEAKRSQTSTEETIYLKRLAGARSVIEWIKKTTTEIK